MNAMMSFMFWKDRQKVRKSEIKSIQQDWNVILQRPAYVACSETIKSATAHRSKGDWIDFVPYFACFRNCLTFFDYLRAGWGTSLKRRRHFASCRGRLQRLASPDIGAYCCFEDVLHRINIFFLNRINIIFFSWMHQGRIKTNREVSRSAFGSRVDTQPHYGGPCKAGHRDQRRLWFLERCTKS